MPAPRVTVIIDTFNHAAFIEQAIDSVLAQDFPAEQMEILLVDDGSTDDTPARVEKYKERVRYLRKENGGQASAFNFAIPQARGEIIAFLDGDDWWAPGKLTAVVAALERHPKVGAVGHGFWQVEDSGAGTSLVVPQHEFLLSARNADDARLFSLLRAFLGTSRFTARRAVLEKILPVPEKLVVEADEYLFTLAVARAGAVVLEQALFYYRLHAENFYQFRRIDEPSLRRKLEVTDCLVQTLPPALRSAGIAEAAIAAILEPVWADREVFRLALDGGMPWETFRAERALARHTFRDKTFAYGVFKAAVLGLALVLPPKTFYRLKRWYSDSGVRRVRSLTGEPTPAAPVVTTPSNRRG